MNIEQNDDNRNISLVNMFANLVGALLLLVDHPDQSRKLPNRVSSPGVSEPQPVHLGHSRSGRPSRRKRDVASCGIGLAPCVALPPLHHVSRWVDFSGAPEQRPEDHLVKVHLSVSGSDLRTRLPSWCWPKTYGIKLVAKFFFPFELELWTESIAYGFHKIEFPAVLVIGA